MTFDYDYEASLHISAEDPPFNSLIFAAFRKADSENLEKLKKAFPVQWQEFQDRYYGRKGK